MLFISQPLFFHLLLTFFFPSFSYLFSFPVPLDYGVEQSAKASPFTVLLWVWDRETAQRHAKSSLTTRLSHILECLVRLHGLLGIQQILPIVQLGCLFLCMCHDPQGQDSNDDGFLPPWVICSLYCGKDGLLSQRCCPAAEERGEVFQPKGNRPKGAVKMKV